MRDARIMIVDPFSSGAMLADALRAKQVEVWAIQSSPAIPPSMRSRFDPGVFEEVIEHGDDLERTLQRAADCQPTHVIAGFESGVELAEWLSARLDLPTNDPRLCTARRDKYLMTQAAARYGLRTARQFCSRDVAELVSWVEMTLDWPVIAKPTRSVASDHVFRCDSVDSLRTAAESILADVNVLGCRNERVLVQELLAGVEYAIDTVSGQGVHKVTAIWRYDRPDDSLEFVPYNAMRLVPYAGTCQAALKAYAVRLLDALGVRFGPAHCELMWVDQHPVLIELGARMSAGINAVLSGICGGISQLDETISVLLDLEQFTAPVSVEPALTKYAANVFLSPLQPGTLVRTRNLDRLEGLSTLHSLSVATQPGTRVERVAGRVTLVSDDPDRIDRDISRIHALEREGLFEIEIASRLTNSGPDHSEESGNEMTEALTPKAEAGSTDLRDPELVHYPRIEDHRLRLCQILQNSGTPVFVCDAQIVVDRYQSLKKPLAELWGPYVIGYSFKTNYLMAESLILQQEGAWAEVVSGHEYEMACRLGHHPSQIIYNGPYKDDVSLHLALQHRSLLNVNDHDELDRIVAGVTGSDQIHEVGIRVTSDLPRLGLSRFGFSMENEEARAAVERIAGCPTLRLVGLHSHLYGDTDDPTLYGLAAERLGRFASESLVDFQRNLKYVDLGGGYPAHSPRPKSRQVWDPQPIGEYVRQIAESLRRYFPDRPTRPTLIMEPGRYLTCDGIVLVTRIVHVKERSGKQVIVCDGSISMVPLTHYCPQIIRLYGPDLFPRVTSRVPTNIQGATCRENDSLYDGDFMVAKVGDYLMHFAVGAYNSSLSPNFIFASPRMEVI